MSEWIRPDGCEGGACVEYRTVDGKVYVRNSTDEDHMVAFTVAEWYAFVAGLVETAVHDARVVINLDNERLTVENARLEKSLTDSACEVESLRAFLHSANQRIEEVEGMVAVLQRGRDQLRAFNRESERQRNEAIAEAAVLRHRDRRTQAVVEAAEAVVAAELVLLKFEYPTAEDDADQAFLDALTAAVAALQDVPASPPESQLPADQPPVEALATDGAGAQGEAQGDYCPVCDHDDHRCPGCGSSVEHGAITCDDCIETPEESVAIVDANLRAKGGSGLTEVLPEPAPKPDGEVPEAGRAGEAQEPSFAERYGRQIDSVIMEDLERSTQDRTEGLDAAIEAATMAILRYDLRVGLATNIRPASHHRCEAEAAIRAASPLIERAALLAAADAWSTEWIEDGTGFPENTDEWLRDRAGRVVGS